MHVEMTSHLQIINGLCPGCLSSLLQQYHPQRSLPSSSKLLFTVRTVNSVTYGERAFSFSAPILWNSLQSFKSALKTFLFSEILFLIYSMRNSISFHFLYMMVIELSGVQFGLKPYAGFQNQYDFRPKLHDPKFNFHFIRSIFKSHNSIA